MTEPTREELLRALTSARSKFHVFSAVISHYLEYGTHLNLINIRDMCKNQNENISKILENDLLYIKEQMYLDVKD